MGLTEVQSVLARLYTDAAWREAFFAEPLQTGGTAGLTPEEAAQLAKMEASDVAFFALTLHQKRLKQIHKLLPLSRRAYGQNFDACFRAYAEGYLPDGTKKHRDDATSFAKYLKKNRPSDAPDYADTVLRYEATWLLARQPKPVLRVCRFRYALKPLLRSLSTPDAKPQAVARESLAVWMHLAPSAELYHWIWR